jgi:hypothetical protein
VDTRRARLINRGPNTQGGDYALHTVQRIDGARPLLRSSGRQWPFAHQSLAVRLLWGHPGPIDPEEQTGEGALSCITSWCNETLPPTTSCR